MSAIENRDYTLIIDKSGSMSTPDQRGGRSRWSAVQESAIAFAAKCEKLDPDGITLYLFSGRFKRFDNSTSSRVSQVFQEYEPAGSTDLAGVLQHATDAYFQRKAIGKAKPETIIVLTDGEPDDQRAVMKVIVEASRKLSRDEELAISLIQIGRDPTATRFLKVLDDDLVRAGAKFDICDTINAEEIEDMPLSEVLLQAIRD